MLCQAGDAIPYLAERLDRGFRAIKEFRVNVRPPSVYLKQFYFDTANFDVKALCLVIEFAAPITCLRGATICTRSAISTRYSPASGCSIFQMRRGPKFWEATPHTSATAMLDSRGHITRMFIENLCKSQLNTFHQNVKKKKPGTPRISNLFISFKKRIYTGCPFSPHCRIGLRKIWFIL